MSTKKDMEKEMDLLLEAEEAATRTEQELLEERESDQRPIDEIPVGVHPLSSPITVDEKTVTEIPYDLSRLTPIQYINLVKRLSKKQQISVPELDMEVQISYFALASGIPVVVLKSQLAIGDYAQVCSLVRSFLLGVSTEDLE